MVKVILLLFLVDTVVTIDEVMLDLLTPGYGEACGYQSCPQVQEDHINVHIVPHTYANLAGVNHFDQIYSGQYGYNVTSELNMKKILDAVISELWGNPERKFTFSDIPYLFKWWSQRDGTVHRMVYQLLRQGRLHLVGGGWSMNDEASTSYHAIIDSFTYSLRKLNSSFLECGRPLVAWQSLSYGHSREFASLMAQMGYDALFINPISYDDEIARMYRRALEILWRGSDDLGADSDIFTHKLFDGFENPPGFCFASNCNDPLIIASDSVLGNVQERVDRFVDSMLHRQLPHYNTTNVMVVMGTRLGYFDANMWFANIEKLINYVNQRGPIEGKRLRLVYSTPACYLRAVHSANVPLEPKQDDFFPVAYDRYTYLAGMYTSRPTVKWLVREGHLYLQMAKQMQVLARLWNNDDKFEQLKWIVGVMQDHNIMSGHITEEVKSYYVKKLERAIQASTLVMKQGLNKLRKCNASTLYYRCNFNISACINTNMKPTFVVIYNLLGWPVSMPVRLPTWNIEYTVFHPNGTTVPYAMMKLPDPVVNLPNRGYFKVDHELVFIAENIPPLGYRSYFIHPNNIRLKRSISDNMETMYRNDYTLKQRMNHYYTAKYRELYRGKRSIDDDDVDDWLSFKKMKPKRSIDETVFFHPNNFYTKRKKDHLPTKHKQAQKPQLKQTHFKPKFTNNYDPYEYKRGKVKNYFRVKQANVNERTTSKPVKHYTVVTVKYNYYINSSDDDDETLKEHHLYHSGDDNSIDHSKYSHSKENSTKDRKNDIGLKRISLIKLNKMKPKKYLFVRQNVPVKRVDQPLKDKEDADFDDAEENDAKNVFDEFYKNYETSTTKRSLVTAFYKIPLTTRRYQNALHNYEVLQNDYMDNNIIRGSTTSKIFLTTGKSFSSTVKRFGSTRKSFGNTGISFGTTGRNFGTTENSFDYLEILPATTKMPKISTTNKRIEPILEPLDPDKSTETILEIELIESSTLPPVRSTTEEGDTSTDTSTPIILSEKTYKPITSTDATIAPIKPQVKETTETPFYGEEVYEDDEDKTWTRRSFDSVYSSDLFISNKYVRVNLRPSSRKVAGIVLSNGVNISLDIQFMYYVSDEPEASSDKDRKQYWPPGARVFRAVDNVPVAVIDRNYDVKVYKNSIVEEYHCTFTNWASLVLRLYAESPVVEVDWLVGPVPIADTFGKDVFIRYTTDIENGGVFYTDSNGRQTIKRIRDFRPTYVIPKQDPVAGNFYPVTSKIFIDDPERNIRFSVFNDRAQGGASLSDGQIDLMLHRRIFTVDGLFILINETEDGQGIRVRGKHYLYLTKADYKPNKIFEKKFAKEIELRPQIFVSEPFPYGNHSKIAWEKRVNEMSMIKKKLPIGVHLLTLEEWNDKTVLIRLENYLEKSDTINSGVKVVHLKDIFNNMKVLSVRETTLAANIWLKDFVPIQWSKRQPFVKNFNEMYGNDTSELNYASDETNRYWVEADVLEVGVVLKPQQIRTFVCSIEYIGI